MWNGAVVVWAYNIDSPADSNWQENKWEDNGHYKSNTCYGSLESEICASDEARTVTGADGVSISGQWLSLIMETYKFYSLNERWCVNMKYVCVFDLAGFHIFHQCLDWLL